MGTAPTAADLYEDAASAVGIMTSPYKFNKLKRFSVLFDGVYDQTLTSNDIVSDYFGTPHEGHILFLNTGGTSASAGKGALFAVITTTDDTNKSLIRLYSRIMFTDD
jgi:hypothetical protein